MKLSQPTSTLLTYRKGYRRCVRWRGRTWRSRLDSKYYNKSARLKDLEVGSRVLVLLPIKKNKLLLQWRGRLSFRKR